MKEMAAVEIIVIIYIMSYKAISIYFHVELYR